MHRCGDDRAARRASVRRASVRRAAVRRRYLSLGCGELAAAVVFAGAARFAIAPRLHRSEWFAFSAALVPLVVILLQGGSYWLLARNWVLRGRMPASTAAFFSWARRLNVLLLAAGALAVAIGWPQRPIVAALVTGVLLFAVIEYLNYFVVRLAYPLRTWITEVSRLRTPRLMRDVRLANT